MIEFALSPTGLLIGGISVTVGLLCYFAGRWECRKIKNYFKDHEMITKNEYEQLIRSVQHE